MLEAFVYIITGVELSDTDNIVVDVINAVTSITPFEVLSGSSKW